MSTLPPIIQQLISIVGIEAVHALLAARLLGFKQRVGRSRQCEWFRDWSAVIGEELADAVMHTWRGQAVFFPACTAAVREERNRRIVIEYDRLIESGNSARAAVRTLCRTRRMSDRQIETIVNRPVIQASAEDLSMGQQLGLF